MKKPFLQFLYKLLLLLVLFYALDFLIGQGLKHFFFTQKYGLDYRVTYAINETKADVLILGSSKAKHHYNTYVFEDSARLSYYDAGREGTDIIYQYAIAKCVLKRYKPKAIVLDFARKSLEYNENSDRISLLLPYYDSHPEIRDLLDAKSPFEKIKRLSHIYPFNSMIYNILARNVSFLKKKDYDENIKGWVPSAIGDTVYLKGILDDPKNNQIPEYTIDSNKTAMFERFVKTCADANVQLLVVVSPYLSSQYVPDQSVEIAKSICEKYKTQFIDFSFMNGISNDVHYFRDGDHMDVKGATEFSKRIVEYIKKP